MNQQRKRRFPKWLMIFALVLAIILTAGILANETIEKLIYPMEFVADVELNAEHYDFPPSLIYAIIHTESKFNPEAISTADAKGLMQITDDTYRWACKRAGEESTTPDDLYNPASNIRIGCYVLSLLYEQFTETETVLAAYNAGQGRVREWLSDPAYSKDGKTLYNIPYEETENYVRRVINTQAKYQKLYNIQ